MKYMRRIGCIVALIFLTACVYKTLVLLDNRRDKLIYAKDEQLRVEREMIDMAEAERVWKEVGESFKNDMVFVQGGTFTMGCTPEQEKDCLWGQVESLPRLPLIFHWLAGRILPFPNEKPAHKVTLSDFYIGKYEVTQTQWLAVMGNKPSDFEGDNMPVTYVSWHDIQEFIVRLNEKTGGNYRLPTEAEWEYAARGGNQSLGYKYSGSNDVEDVAWYKYNYGGTAHPVGTKKANELGIYNMSGNVSEWVNDWYGNYGINSQTDPDGNSKGMYRVARGGGGYHGASWMRVSDRRSNVPGGAYKLRGFRLAHSSELQR